MTPTREGLLALLQERPGLTPAHAARRLGVDPTTAGYHLRRLAREGRAVASGPPRARRWSPPGRRPAPASPPRRDADVLDALRAHPGITASGLARRLGLPRPTLHGRLGRLRRAGLVRATRAGREVRLHAADS